MRGTKCGTTAASTGSFGITHTQPTLPQRYVEEQAEDRAGIPHHITQRGSGPPACSTAFRIVVVLLLYSTSPAGRPAARRFATYRISGTFDVVSHVHRSISRYPGDAIQARYPLRKAINADEKHIYEHLHEVATLDSCLVVSRSSTRACNIRRGCFFFVSRPTAKPVHGSNANATHGRRQPRGVVVI
jgi:hypothetical protein